MSVRVKRFFTILLALIPLTYYFYLLFYSNIEDSYFFFIYNSLIIFSLPFLLSRYIHFKIHAAFLFLIYPATYILSFLLSKILPFELTNILYLNSIFIILAWNYLIASLIWKLKWSVLKRFFIEKSYLVLIFLIYSSLFLLLRHIDTVISLDYLQHYTVSEKMRIGEQFCLTPNQCSELFLKVGYTTIYHSILGFLTTFSNENPLRAMFFIDFTYPLVIATLVFHFLKRFTKNLILVSLFSLMTILIYVNGTYETTLFLPQTLAFLLFLSIVMQKKTKFSTLIGGGFLLTFTHFVMGPFLFMFLLLKYILLEKIDAKILGSFSKYIFFFSLFTPLLFVLINSSGFSIEETFQKSDLEMIGGFTNMPFPHNIFIYLSIWGGLGVFLLFSILFQQRKNKPWYIYSLMYLSFTLCLYLLAPTYANKFLMGISIFSVVLMIKYLENIKEIPIKILIATILVGFLIPNFYFQTSRSLDFYRQRDNIATAVPVRNMYLIEHLKNLEDVDCIFVSDPLTQIQAEGLGGQNTARAQYILPESRKRIFEFSKNPSLETYTNFRGIEELKGREMCFIYSSIIHTSVQRDEINWLFHMFSLPKDDSNPVQETDVKYFMVERGYEVTYQGPQFIVFVKR